MSLCNLTDKVQIQDLPHSGPSVVLSTLLPISSSHDISPTKRLIQLAPSCAPGFGIFAQAAPAFSCVCASSLSHVPLFVTPWTIARQAPLSMWFSRQEHWSGLPCPPPGDLSNPGIELESPALQVDSLPAELVWRLLHSLYQLSW